MGFGGGQAEAEVFDGQGEPDGGFVEFQDSLFFFVREARVEDDLSKFVLGRRVQVRFHNVFGGMGPACAVVR